MKSLTFLLIFLIIVSTGRNSGGLKSLEALERGNIEDKFDLYKKRTKNALSPERPQRAGGRSASVSSGR